MECLKHLYLTPYDKNLKRQTFFLTMFCLLRCLVVDEGIFPCDDGNTCHLKVSGIGVFRRYWAEVVLQIC